METSHLTSDNCTESTVKLENFTVYRFVKYWEILLNFSIAEIPEFCSFDKVLFLLHRQSLLTTRNTNDGSQSLKNNPQGVSAIENSSLVSLSQTLSTLFTTPPKLPLLHFSLLLINPFPRC